MSEKMIEVKVKRYTPTADREPRFQIYEIPLTQGSNVMNILDYIRQNIDSTLAYQKHTACLRGLCGRCTLIINGKASLACATAVNGDLQIEPPKQVNIVRDLVYKRNRRIIRTRSLGDETRKLGET